jgi:hypothetical protein
MLSGAAVELTRLQPLHAVCPIEQIVLFGRIVARIESRIADHGYLAAVEIEDVGDRQLERLAIGGQSFDLEDCHVPVGVDHHHPPHQEGCPLCPASLPLEVDSGFVPSLECEIAIAEAGGENPCDVSIGHQETVANDESRAAVGVLEVSRKFNASYRRNCGFDPAANGCIRCEVGPQTVR